MRVLYFAWVRERIGRAEERIDPPATVTTAAELADWLSLRGPGYESAFAGRKRLRVAINQDQADFPDTVSPGDEIAFFPPMTGG